MPVSACSVAVIKAKMNIFLWVMAPSLLLSSRVCSVCVRVRASFMHVSFMHLPKYCRFVHSCMSCDLWSCVVPVKTRYHSLSISAVTVKHYQKTRSKHWTRSMKWKSIRGLQFGRSQIQCVLYVLMQYSVHMVSWSQSTYVRFFFFSPLVPM